MLRRFRFQPCCLLAVAVLGLPFSGRAKMEEWKDTQGERFRGEPAEVLGPLALFRTGHQNGRHLPFRSLAPEDCVRFYEQVRNRPARADDWSRPAGMVSQELAGNLLRLENDRLAPATVKGLPEPEFYVLFFASHDEGRSWEMMGDARPLYDKLRQDFPGQMEAVLFGTSKSKSDHNDMAVSMHLPWLVTDFSSQRSMSTIGALSAGAKYGIIAVNRDGVPLCSTPGETTAAVQEFMGTLRLLLDALRPGNPKTWGDRAYYLRAVQPAIYRQSRCDPVLVGNPLMAEGLRQRSVYRFDATCTVGADGRVTAVALAPGGDLPAAMASPLADALRTAVFVAAVDHGVFVEAPFPYHFETQH